MGLLGAVALYFWAPLVWGWICPKPAATPDGKAAAPAVAGRTPANGAATPATADRQLSWQELIAAMDSDPRKIAASLLDSLRDPFARPKPKSMPVVPAEIAKPQAVTPQSLGVVLMGTLLSDGRRAARINGKTFDEGQLIEVIKDGRSARFQLAEVQPRKVVLTRQNERFELVLPAPGRSGRIELMATER